MPGFWRTLTATVHGSGGTTSDQARDAFGAAPADFVCVAGGVVTDLKRV